MTDLDLERAKALLRQGYTVAETAEQLGVPERTLRDRFARVVGMSPRAFRLAEGGSTAAGASQVVSFRLSEYPDLVVAAEEAGVAPSDWARDAVRTALRRRPKKK